MRHRFSILLLALLMGCISCDVPKVDGSQMEVTFAIPEPPNYVIQHQRRYAVIWMGPNIWKVTNDGPISPSQTEVTINIATPQRSTLTQVEPAETLSYSYFYLPETDARRPRIVSYDDQNENKQFDIEMDRILAIDGFQLAFQACIVAILDLDKFLSQLTIEETQIYYGWTDNKYSQLLFGATDPAWNNFIVPLFEDSSFDPTGTPQPTLELQTGNELLLKKDLECYRQVTDIVTTTQEQIWVDSTLDVSAFCADAVVPCASFDTNDPSAIPNLYAVKQSVEQPTSVSSSTCGRANNVYHPLTISQGEVSCEDCTCTYTMASTLYYLNYLHPPDWSPCGAGAAGTLSK